MSRIEEILAQKPLALVPQPRAVLQGPGRECGGVGWVALFNLSRTFVGLGATLPKAVPACHKVEVS